MQKSLILIKGEDLLEFLQSIITVDVMQKKQQIFSLLLNAKGRCICSFFILKAADNIENLCQQTTNSAYDLKKYSYKYHNSEGFLNNEVLICIDSSVCNVFIDKMNQYKFDLDTSVIKLNADLYFTSEVLDENNIYINYHNLNLYFTDLKPKNVLFESDYNLIRYKNCILENDELNGVIPVECNLKGGLSQNKGCYIGQELTNRSLVIMKVNRELKYVKFIFSSVNYIEELSNEINDFENITFTLQNRQCFIIKSHLIFEDNIGHCICLVTKNITANDIKNAECNIKNFLKNVNQIII